MKKRILSVFMCMMLLLCFTAQAQELTPFEQFCMKGKEGLRLLSMGKMNEALSVLGFAFEVESGQTEETFRAFVSTLTMLDEWNLQTDVALCWLDERGVWHLGIPLVEPISWDVEVLVLDSRDLTIFCGYSLSTWGALEEVGATYSEAYWNQEYMPIMPMLLADE